MPTHYSNCQLELTIRLLYREKRPKLSKILAMCHKLIPQGSSTPVKFLSLKCKSSEVPKLFFLMMLIRSGRKSLRTRNSNFYRNSSPVKTLTIWSSRNAMKIHRLWVCLTVTGSRLVSLFGRIRTTPTASKLATGQP